MTETCTTCGLPKNSCVCIEIEKEQQKIRIKIVKTRFNKVITIISGFDDKEKAKELEKELKRKLACGGTIKENNIELQGDHRKKIKPILIAHGYKEELIEGV